MNNKKYFWGRVAVLLSISVAISLLLMLPQEETPNKYRESKGTVVKFLVEQSDPIFTTTYFVKLQDGEVIRPKLYYRQGHFTSLGFRMVEKPRARTQTTSIKHKKDLYLPTTQAIKTYLLLVRAPAPKGEVEENGQKKTVYEPSGWQLLEIPAKDVLSNKKIVFPKFEEIVLQNQELSQEQLLQDLRARYAKIKQAAIKKANTPITSDTKLEWWEK